MSEPLELPGIDGANPLGFLAALGAHVTLVEAGESAARLYWKGGATWRPCLAGLHNSEAICTTLATALRGHEVSPDAESARAIAKKEFDTAVTRKKKAEKTFKERGLQKKERMEALKLFVEECDSKRRAFLEKLNAAVPRPELSLGKKIDLSGDEFRVKAREFLNDHIPDRSAITMLAALALEGDGNTRCRRTEFDFVDSSGRLEFLETVRQLMLPERVTPERLRATLFEPWQRADERWSLRFDPVEDRRYALLDRDPTANDNKSRSEWMANLLAYCALSFFPCAITELGNATACWHKDSRGLTFTWPLWSVPLSSDTIRSLLGHQSLMSSSPTASLRMLGVEVVFRSRRISNGDYVNFSPSFGL